MKKGKIFKKSINANKEKKYSRFDAATLLFFEIKEALTEIASEEPRLQYHGAKPLYASRKILDRPM